MTEMISWRERIQIARQRGSFTFSEQTSAAMWHTCAVGEQHALHPEVVRYGERWEGPEDYKLTALGSSMVDGFAVAVGRNDFNRAEALLDLIEDRVLQLKREQGT